MFGYEVIVILLMLASTAIFAGYEMGLASISRARLGALLAENKKGAAEAVYMKDHIEASLAVIQLGITLVGALAAGAAGTGVGDKVAPYLVKVYAFPVLLAQILALLMFIIPLTFVTIVFAELVPKMIALNNKEWVVLRLSPPMKGISTVASPLISVIEIVVKKTVGLFTRLNTQELSDKSQSLHELKAAATLARSAKILGAREERIVLTAASFSLKKVKDIVIPAQDISLLWVEDSLMTALLKAHLDMHTRFPVCLKDNDPQTIQGYVNFKDIVVALKVNPTNPSIRQIMRPIKKVDEDTPLSELLEMMIQEKMHIVVVIAKTNGILGMVTLEDINEELMGKIEDEFDRLPVHVHACGDAAWIMGGGITMDTVMSAVGLNWEEKFKDKKFPTLAEWCAMKAKVPLTGGEQLVIDGLRVVPRKFRRKKVSEAVVSAA